MATQKYIIQILLYSCVFLISSFRGNAQSDFEKAQGYYAKEQFSKAKPLFQNYLKANPKHKRTREYLGDIAGHEKDWDTAIDYFEDLVAEEQNNANYHFKYGGVLGMKALSISKIRAALYISDIKEAFETAATLDPKHIETRWALVELYMQLPAIIGGSEDTSTKYANQLLDISPVDGYLAKGYIAEYANRPQEAENHYKNAIKIGGSMHTYEKLTNLYEKNNQPQKAIENVQDCLKTHDRNSLHYQIGKIVAQYNLDASLGITCLNKYIENYSIRDGVPKDWAYYRLAQIYKNLNNKTEALSWIDKALSSRPDFKEALQEKKNILAL